MFRYRQCAWCGRLKHADGHAHGHAHGHAFSVRLLARLGYSHGVCSECKAKIASS